MRADRRPPAGSVETTRGEQRTPRTNLAAEVWILEQVPALVALHVHPGGRPGVRERLRVARTADRAVQPHRRLTDPRPRGARGPTLRVPAPRPAAHHRPTVSSALGSDPAHAL